MKNEKYSFNIATFNINKDDGNFPKRVYELKNHIDQFDMDILCFQEDYHSETFSSTDRLNKKLCFFKSTIETRKKKRLNVVSSSNLTILSKLKPVIVKSIYFNEIEKEQRAALFAYFRLEDKTLLVVNTHLCHLETKNRLYQLEKIVQYIQTKKISHVLLCGDLNSTPDSKEIEFLKEKGFRYNNNKITASRGKIIDYIMFYGDMECIKSDIVLKDYSDHYCLLNTIEL
jgi:endonuclease/exonuclease/phosphatase family metal-dependent hydrolase